MWCTAIVCCTTHLVLVTSDRELTPVATKKRINVDVKGLREGNIHCIIVWASTYTKYAEQVYIHGPSWVVRSPEQLPGAPRVWVETESAVILDGWEVLE
jgi:hypothetical protein